ncbi:MAG: DUF3459 domain-containing protein, partial [Terriglobales bacterium]
LLLIRRNRIVPYLRGSKGNSARFAVNGKTGLTVSWNLGDETLLFLIGNLGKEAAGPVQCPIGDLIYSNKAINPGPKIQLSPWHVAWFLQQ